jgi:hypothetical protein
MLCKICGLTYYSRSYGGDGICPSCDCGNFGLPAVERQAKRIQELEAVLREVFNEWLPAAWNRKIAAVLGITDNTEGGK